MGALYIVSTPIGNLQDITLRAIAVLGEVDFILCEDTRTSSVLLKSLKENFPDFKNKARLVSYYEENEQQRIPEVLDLLKKDFSFALISDAGTPAISDPGFRLIRECVNSDIKVESIPGPSSVLAALTSSGLPTDKFMFVGFLPKKPGHRNEALKKMKQTLEILPQTVILFESPFRIKQTMEELQEVFGDIEVVLARELTKMHEEIRRGKITELQKHFEKTNPKGEFVVLFNLK